MSAEQALPLFYKKVMPIMKNRHSDWKIAKHQDFNFAGETNSVFLTTVEFIQAAKYYPIVFSKTGDGLFPVVLLGLGDKQNLFVNASGQWDVPYVPAYVRRYPFILASKDGKTHTVCIDEQFSGINQDDGEPLFLENGEYSEYLDRSVNFLKEYEAQVQLSRDFASQLQTLDLLEPTQAQIDLKGSGEFALTGFSVISRERLAKLDSTTIEQLFRSGRLELIYAHLASLSNFDGLLKRHMMLSGSQSSQTQH